MKKVLLFFAFGICIASAIACVWYALYSKAYVIAVASLILSGAAYPSVRKLYDKIIDNG